MSGKEENRIFVGGLGWDVTERQLEHAFDRYGKILECQVPLNLPTIYFVSILSKIYHFFFSIFVFLVVVIVVTGRILFS